MFLNAFTIQLYYKFVQHKRRVWREGGTMTQQHTHSPGFLLQHPNQISRLRGESTEECYIWSFVFIKVRWYFTFFFWSKTSSTTTSSQVQISIFCRSKSWYSSFLRAIEIYCCPKTKNQWATPLHRIKTNDLISTNINCSLSWVNPTTVLLTNTINLQLKIDRKSVV